MSVISLDKDFDNLTMTLVAEFDAPPERVWDLWADPRKLERWWGPPMAPSTFERFELEPGDTVTYFMTGPEGERFHGVWHVIAVDPPRSLHVEDSFADADGNVDPDMPTGQMHMHPHRAGRAHAHGAHLGQRLQGGDAAAARHGRRRGHAGGDRPDGRAARGVAPARRTPPRARGSRAEASGRSPAWR